MPLTKKVLFKYNTKIINFFQAENGDKFENLNEI